MDNEQRGHTETSPRSPTGRRPPQRRPTESGIVDVLAFPRQEARPVDDLHRLRARLVVRIALLSVPFWIFYGVIWYFTGLPNGLWFSMFGALGCLSWIPVQRAGVSPLLAGRGLAITAASTFTCLALFVRGLDISLLSWNLLIPVAAVLFRGTRTALGWVSVLAISWLLMWWLDGRALLPTPEDTLPSDVLRLLDLSNLLGAALMLVMIVGTHSRVQAKQQAEREELRHKLSETEHWASLGTLAASIGHEINNPLAYIIHNLEYLSDLGQRERSATDDEPKALKDALDGAKRVQRITARLNALARPSIEPGPIRVQQSVQMALDLAQSALLQVKTVQVDIAPDLAVRATEQLVQVVLNLLVNAADAISESACDDGLLEIKGYAEGDWGVIEVRDNGTGIPEEIREHVFEPFFTTKGPGKGTGLGLAISAQIVEQLSGRIRVEPQRPKGTIARVRLPCSVAGPASVAQMPLLEQQPARVLVIDDEPALARAMRRHLRSFQVDTATNAAQALELLRSGQCPDGPSRPHDLVLCDVMMPDVTGPEIYERVHEELGPDVAGRFVFMTGGTFLANQTEALKRTGRRTLPKPIDEETVRAELERVSRKKTN